MFATMRMAAVNVTRPDQPELEVSSICDFMIAEPGTASRCAVSRSSDVSPNAV